MSPTSIFTLGRGFGSCNFGNSFSLRSEGCTLKSSLSIGGTNRLQGRGGEFLGFLGLIPAPFLEDDIKRGSGDTLEDGCNGEYDENGTQG